MPALQPIERYVDLRDGRTLAFAEWGAPSGIVLLYFGASRLEAKFLADQATRRGIRLIGVDRPGMGFSRFQPGRRIIDWADDVAQLADALEIGRFSVVGMSGGGPYALACAHNIPDRLRACGIVSGVGPVSVFAYQRHPWLITPMFRIVGWFFRDRTHAERALSRFTRGWPRPDRAILENPTVRDIVATSQSEAFRQGARGLTYDVRLIEGEQWGFELEEISCPTLHLWHGELDADTPVVMARTVVERLPRCHATFYPDDGHISVIVNHAEEIVTALAA